MQINLSVARRPTGINLHSPSPKTPVPKQANRQTDAFTPRFGADQPIPSLSVRIDDLPKVGQRNRLTVETQDPAISDDQEGLTMVVSSSGLKIAKPGSDQLEMFQEVPMPYDPVDQKHKAEVDIIPQRAGKHDIGILLTMSLKNHPRISEIYRHNTAHLTVASENANGTDSPAGQ